MEILVDRTELVTRYAPGGAWAELGVARGGFAADMIKRPDVRELWLIDCWGPYPEADPQDTSVWDHAVGETLYQKVKARFQNDSRVHILRMLIEDAAKKFPQNYFDFVYVDAGHTYDAVRRHLNLFYPLLKPGGLLAGHDYWNTGDVQHVKDVRRAVDDWCAENGLAISVLTTEPFGSFGIRKPG